MRKIDEQSRAALLDCLRRTYDRLCVADGGPGSGNFGHGGRPGEIGGSSSSGGGATEKSGEKKAKRYTKEEIEKMPLAKLRKESERLSAVYYKSGLSGIHFGNTPPEKAAQLLTAQATTPQLRKSLASVQRKLAKAGLL